MSYEYREIFLEEVEEQLEILNNALLELEKDKHNLDYIHSVFRVTHTLKSSAAFVGLSDLSDFAHSVESLLQLILDNKVEPSTNIVDILFEAFDAIKVYISKFSKNEDLDLDFTDINSKVKALIQTSGKKVSPSNKLGEKKFIEDEKEEIVEVDITLDFTDEELENFYFDGINKFSITKDALYKAQSNGNALFYMNIFLEENVKMKWVRGELILVSLEKKGKIINSIPHIDKLKTDEFDRTLEIIVESDCDEETLKNSADVDQVMFILVREINESDLFKNSIEPHGLTLLETETGYDKFNADVKINETSVDEDFLEKSDKKSTKSKSSTILNQSQSVRVPIEKLDSLLNLVGELAIVNSGFVEIQDRFRNMLGGKTIVGELRDKIESLSNIAKLLQEGIMQSRMVPIGFVMSRFNRLVRDLSNSLNKKINLVMHGEDTELDKKIIDAIGEPLIHLIRNSIDHGIESEAERIKKGKNPLGTVELDAFQRGNHIIIEVKDDGEGLNRDAISKKAIKSGLIDEAEAKTLDDQSIYHLIFEPGFSTKTEVTDLSGRGMGMNIVKETVEQLNGTVTLHSKPDKGTTFSLAFPLTMAILPAILSSVGDEVFAIPLYNVFETLKIKPSDIETIDFKEVLRVRDEVIELCWLSDLIDGNRTLKNDSNKISVIIVEFDNLRFGIIVDDLIGKREIVTKSISHYFKDKELDGISGATILGNGKIALILDILTLVKRFRIEKGNKKSFRSGKLAIEKINKVDEFMTNEENEKNILKILNITDKAFKSIAELYKIGISNASKNISKFLMSDIAISAPLVRLHSIGEYRKQSFYFNQGNYYICEMDLTNGAGGKFILVLDDNSVQQLYSTILGAEVELGSELANSSIMETTNILGAGITNTLSNALKMSIYISTPKLHYMSLEEYFGRFLDEFKIGNEYIWAILASILHNKKTLEGRIYIIPDQATFYKMREAILNDKELMLFIENVMV